MTVSEWLNELSLLEERFGSVVKETPDPDSITEKFIGRKGELTLLLRKLSEFPLEEKKLLGRKGNELKEKITSFIEEKRKAFSRR